MHYGRPTPEICEAYTRVLQGHVRHLSSFTVLVYAELTTVDLLLLRLPLIVPYFRKKPLVVSWTSLLARPFGKTA